ncbi:MAG: hypothetical protein ACI9UN_002989 [Granulosicoccus sp.]|jgi:hypothetical protein
MIVFKTKSKTLIATTVLAGTFSAFAASANAAPINFDGSVVGAAASVVLGA